MKNMNATTNLPLPDKNLAPRSRNIDGSEFTHPIHPTAASPFARTVIIARPIADHRKSYVASYASDLTITRWDHGGINE